MKSIKCKIDSKNIVGFRVVENLRKGPKSDTVTLIVGITSDYFMCDMSYSVSNTFFSLGGLAKKRGISYPLILLEEKKKGTKLYCTLLNMMLICELKLTFDENKVMTNCVTSLYKTEVINDDTIDVRCVTDLYDSAIRNVILKNMTPYIGLVTGDFIR